MPGVSIQAQVTDAINQHQRHTDASREYLDRHKEDPHMPTFICKYITQGLGLSLFIGVAWTLKERELGSGECGYTYRCRSFFCGLQANESIFSPGFNLLSGNNFCFLVFPK